MKQIVVTIITIAAIFLSSCRIEPNEEARNCNTYVYEAPDNGLILEYGIYYEAMGHGRLIDVQPANDHAIETSYVFIDSDDVVRIAEIVCEDKIK